MYRIPRNLDLSGVIGESTTQLRVGQFDLQFTFGPVSFSVESPVQLFKHGVLVAHWEQGKWPESGFYDMMNSEAKRCEVVTDRLLVIELENGIEIHLQDSSDQYESMSISIDGQDEKWII